MTAMPIVETNSIQALKRLVINSPRVSLLNRLDVVEECQRGALVFRKLSDAELDSQPLALVSRARSTPSPMASLFAEALRSVLPDLID